MKRYPNNLKNWDLDSVKAPGLIDRRRPNISNIGSSTIDQSRELSRCPNPSSSGCLGIAISPCPNDTFVFYPWKEGIVGSDLPIELYFADIDQLNRCASEKLYPLIKASFPCFSKMINDYQLLSVGAALGWNCGPKLVADAPFLLDQLSQKTVALPGRDTTAHHLMRLMAPPPKKKIFVTYDRIVATILNKEADCGVIIHESRFTFQAHGLKEVADLGELWHQKTQLPLPLGGLLIDRKLPSTIKNRVVTILKESLAYVQKKPESALPFILFQAQEKNPAIVLQHIKTYVTDETASLSSAGVAAIQKLIGCGEPTKWLYG